MHIEKMTLSDFEEIKGTLKSDFDDFWSENILKQELLNDNCYYLVAKDNDEVVGFAGIRIVLDETELMYIVVRRDKRHTGIGKLLLENLINYAKSIDAKVMKLEVNENNLAAINLYKSFGFELKRN